MNFERTCNNCKKRYSFKADGSLLYFSHCSSKCCEEDFINAKIPFGFIPSKCSEAFNRVFNLKYTTYNN